jgi:hypothetical protein
MEKLLESVYKLPSQLKSSFRRPAALARQRGEKPESSVFNPAKGGTGCRIRSGMTGNTVYGQTLIKPFNPIFHFSIIPVAHVDPMGG